MDYELQPPEAAIPPEEDAVSIDAVLAMRATFAQDSPAVRALFDTLVESLTGGANRTHQRANLRLVLPPRYPGPKR